MTIHALTERLANAQSLSQSESESLFSAMLSGGMDHPLIHTALVALKQKGETTDEIIGAARAMRGSMRRFDAPEGAIDVCGTGGDGLGTLNISTAVALVVASCGVPVVKHGNRAVSSQSGSSDVLGALGIALSDDMDRLTQCLNHTHFCYLPAPLFHPGMKYVATVRAEIKTRTIFNLLGPLCNPSQPTRQLMGVYDQALVEPIARAMQSLGMEHAMAVHGADGLDEISVSTHTTIAELSQDAIHSFTFTPEDAGLSHYPSGCLTGGAALYNAAAMGRLFNGEAGAYRDAVLLNAAAALRVAGRCDDWHSGTLLAGAAIDSGRTLSTLNAVIQHMQAG